MNFLKPTKFAFAVATLVGSTIGVGVYGIPFAFQKAGFGFGLIFLISVVGLVILSNLLYGEVTLRTYGKHHFIGYVSKYLGPWSKRINLFAFWIAVYGSLVGVIIISGEFLSNILGSFFNFSSFTFSSIFLVLASILILTGLKMISKIDFIMIFVFLGIILWIAFWGIPASSLNNFSFSISEFWFLPFGVILFAMNAMPGVPLVREVLIGQEEKMKKALITGTLIPAVFYLFFTIIIVGISGETTSPDAISGLFIYLGNKVVLLGSILGFLTSFTIFINMATSLRESFQLDFKFNKFWSWALVIFPPYILFLLGVRNFIDVIDLVGGLAVGLEIILLIMLYAKVKRAGERIPEYSIRLPLWLLYLLIGLLGFGAIYTLFVK